MRLPTLLPPLDGPPPSLPRALDLASERWWGLPPRARMLLAGLVAGVLVLITVAPGLPRAGSTAVEVAVAARDLPAGHELSSGDLRSERRPAELLPTGATAPGATGTLTSALPRGAVLTDEHLGTGGIGALLGEGRAAVAVPADLIADPRAGVAVELVATDDPGGSTGASPAPGRILRVDAEHVWVEVDASRAGTVAAAATRRSIAVVVRPSAPTSR